MSDNPVRVHDVRLLTGCLYRITMAQEERILSGFEKRWLRLFADGVSADMLKQHVLAAGNYIWHVFTWELLPRGSWLEGDEARNAFDAADKTGAKYRSGAGICHTAKKFS